MTSPTFDHFTAALTEWVPLRWLNRHLSEAFSLFAHGYPAPEAGRYLRALRRDRR